MYTGIFDKIEIICHVHGSFVQTAHDHLYSGCTKCGTIKIANSCRKKQHKFIETAKLVHHDKYNYSNINYINNKTNIEIICKKHGSFWQCPSHHLNGIGCYKCCL